MDKVVVIGGGPAGLMAASQAALRGLNVTLVERNERCARKLMITGKGRCNITNAVFDIQDLLSNIPRNPRFLYSAFNAFMTYDTISFFEDLGVQTKIERGNRVFPVTDKAVTVVDALVNYAKKCGVKTYHQRVVGLIFDTKIKGVVFEDGTNMECDAVIVATGGKSYPQTGSTGDGYTLAKSAGHTVTPIFPSLVALNAHEYWCADLQGLSLKNASISLVDKRKGKEVYSDFGEMLFTHFGVSGPMILSASSHMEPDLKDRYKIIIDLKPALTFEQLDKRVTKDLLENSNKDFINSLSALLPHKLVPVIVKLSGIQPSTKCNQITKEMRHRLVELLKGLEVNITSFRSIDEAIVTSGGVNVKEIDPKTMQSKLVKNLYFAGEVIDVDAYTGGFNLQIAFSTGYLAGTKVLEENNND